MIKHQGPKISLFQDHHNHHKTTAQSLLEKNHTFQDHLPFQPRQTIQSVKKTQPFQDHPLTTSKILTTGLQSLQYHPTQVLHSKTLFASETYYPLTTAKLQKNISLCSSLIFMMSPPQSLTYHSLPPQQMHKAVTAVKMTVIQQHSNLSTTNTSSMQLRPSVPTSCNNYNETFLSNNHGHPQVKMYPYSNK